MFDKDLAQVLERLRELVRCCLLKLLHGSAGADVCSTDKTPSKLDQLFDPLTAMSQGVRTPPVSDDGACSHSRVQPRYQFSGFISRVNL